MRALALVTTILVSGCDSTDQDIHKPVITTAAEFIGYSETTHRQELHDYTGVDPVRVEWCAAFANSVLEESGIPSNSTHKYPLTARSFLDWGVAVSKQNIQAGDIVIFPRGNSSWQGHVGFYIKTQYIDNKEYYWILGGNQSNKVSVVLYPSKKALGIRRNLDKYIH